MGGHSGSLCYNKFQAFVAKDGADKVSEFINFIYRKLLAILGLWTTEDPECKVIGLCWGSN